MINLAVGLTLLRAGRRARSIVLEADGKHLITDVWTSIGVIVGVAGVALTGWDRLDPIVALAVAANILVAGGGLLRRSAGGLMDRALEEPDLAAIQEALAEFERDGVRFHALRTRQAGSRRFVSMHVLVPGAWTVQRGHDLVEQRRGVAVRGACPARASSPTSSRPRTRARSPTRPSTARAERTNVTGDGERRRGVQGIRGGRVVAAG